ncbi:MAG: DUF378 domain-containing protein [Patescibacteria group bacterium]|mgnify:CR=1 FL=1
MKNLSTIDWIALVLVIIGGLNWGVIGFFNLDLLGQILVDASGLSRIVYGLVGLSALYLVFTMKKLARK